LNSAGDSLLFSSLKPLRGPRGMLFVPVIEPLFRQAMVMLLNRKTIFVSGGEQKEKMMSAEIKCLASENSTSITSQASRKSYRNIPLANLLATSIGLARRISTTRGMIKIVPNFLASMVQPNL